VGVRGYGLGNQAGTFVCHWEAHARDDSALFAPCKRGSAMRDFNSQPTDGFHFYERGVEDIFGGTVDFAQLVKLFGDYGQFGDERYSPPRITEVISKVRDGRPRSGTHQH